MSHVPPAPVPPPPDGPLVEVAGGTVVAGRGGALISDGHPLISHQVFSPVHSSTPIAWKKVLTIAQAPNIMTMPITTEVISFLAWPSIAGPPLPPPGII